MIGKFHHNFVIFTYHLYILWCFIIQVCKFWDFCLISGYCQRFPCTRYRKFTIFRHWFLFPDHSFDAVLQKDYMISLNLLLQWYNLTNLWIILLFCNQGPCTSTRWSNPYLQEHPLSLSQLGLQPAQCWDQYHDGNGERTQWLYSSGEPTEGEGEGSGGSPGQIWCWQNWT